MLVIRGKITNIILASILCLQALSVKADINPDLESELNSMVADEIIIKFRAKPKLKNKLVSKYKMSSSAGTRISSEANREILNSIAEHYNLPVDESAPENDGYSRLSSSHVYQAGSSPLALRLASTDGSSTALLKLRKGTSKLKLQRAIRMIDAEKLSTDEYEVLAVYPNYLYEITTSPNDSQFSSQTALSQINIDEAWAKSKGAGVIVAVIDTGVDYDHKDLADNIWTNPNEIANNGKDDDNNGYIDDTRGWDFIKRAGSSCIYGEDCSGRDNDPSDYNGHGTHVAGIIAAVQNNEYGISGVAPKAKIMPLKAAYSVGYSAFLKSSDVAEAIEYAIRNGADVVNMSFAGSKLGVLSDVVKRAQELGVVMVAAAGNSGSDTETFPAALDDVIAVGSIDASGEQASYSNYGDWVDIMAPGSNIISLAPGGDLVRKTGTSMSAPLVAGVAALVISKSKELNLSPEQVRERIVNSSNSGSQTLVTSAAAAKLNADIIYPLQVDEMEVPRIAGFNQAVHFSGSGTEDKQEAADYEWVSDLDGLLSHESEFELDNLSPGNHKISLRVRNSSGDWSASVVKPLTIDSENRIFTQSNNKITARIRRHSGKLIASMPYSDRGFVEEYIWSSNKDGELKDSNRSIPVTELSPGLHKLSLVIHDRRGYFTAPIERVVEIKS